MSLSTEKLVQDLLTSDDETFSILALAILGRVSGGLAHEFNNALTILKSSAGQIKGMTAGPIDAEKLKVIVSRIEVAIGRIHDLSNDMNRLSHIDRAESSNLVCVEKIFELIARISRHQLVKNNIAFTYPTSEQSSHCLHTSMNVFAFAVMSFVLFAMNHVNSETEPKQIELRTKEAGPSIAIEIAMSASIKESRKIIESIQYGVGERLIKTLQGEVQVSSTEKETVITLKVPESTEATEL